MNYTTTANDPDPPIDWDLSRTTPTAQPREDSIAGMTQEEFKMLLECKRIAEDILYILSNGNYKDPPQEPANLMQNVHSNLELTKTIIEELSTIKDLVCG